MNIIKKCCSGAEYRRGAPARCVGVGAARGLHPVNQTLTLVDKNYVAPYIITELEFARYNHRSIALQVSKA